MSLYHQEFPIKAKDFVHAGEASIQIKNILKGIGASPEIVRRLAIASYEAEMNAVIYGQGGKMVLDLAEEEVVVRVEDEGPGIPDLDLAMQEGWSTAPDEVREMGFGAGMGLPNIRKNSDELVIDTGRGRGCRLKMVFKAWRGGR